MLDVAQLCQAAGYLFLPAKRLVLNAVVQTLESLPIADAGGRLWHSGCINIFKRSQTR